MTISAFHRLISAENICSSWDDFWRTAATQRASGVDGVTPANFRLRLAHNLAETRAKLVSGYTFSPLKGHLVPKKDGRLRIICIPTVRDRLVQRLVGKYLAEQAEKLGVLNQVSFGFIPKRGVRAARDRAIALRHNYRWAYKSDISSFFDRIPRHQLIGDTIRALRAPSFRPILTAVASCELDMSNAVLARLAQENGIRCGLGVRQGMPLSPMFANIILRRFDEGMMAAGKQVVRYADDFIALAASERECREIDSLARRLLAPLNLALPPLDQDNSKTAIAPPDQEIEFLGLALAPSSNDTYHLVITKSQIEKIKRTLNQLKDVEQLVQQDVTIGKLAWLVDSKTSGYAAAYSAAQNFDELEDVLEKARSDILRSILVSAFGESKIQSLRPPYTHFLGLSQSASPHRYRNAQPTRPSN